METEQLVRQLQQQVKDLQHTVLQVQQQLQQQQQQQQQEGRAMRDSVDQLVRDTNWAAACSIDRQQRQSLYSVRLLRSRDPGALPCEATPAGVAAFLQCEAGSILHVERMRDNAHGKQRYAVQFCTAEAATAACAGFRASSNAVQAVLAQKGTRLQNALVDLAIQLQHIGRGQCAFGEELVVLARGTRVLVKCGEGELVPYPFLQHLPAGRLPNPGQPFQHLTAGRVGQQLKLLLYKPAPPAAQAPPSPAPPPRTSASAAAAVPPPPARAPAAAAAAATAGATTAAVVTAAAAGRAPTTPTKRLRLHSQEQHSQEHDPAQHQHCPPSAAGAAASVQNLHAGAFAAKQRGDQDSRARVHKTAKTINGSWDPTRRYGGENWGVPVPSKYRAMFGGMYGNRMGFVGGRKHLSKYLGADELR